MIKLLKVYAVKICKLLSFAVALTFFLPATAQVTTGTISGRVVDPQGAVVSGAAVTVTSTTTDVAHSVTTNQDGLYTVPLLLPGSYTVSAEAPSFRKEIRNNITLQIGQTLDLEFNLSVGATTQTVTVNTAPPLIQTQSAAVGSVIDNQKILEIPLNGRQYYSLAELIPGAQPPIYNSSLSYRGGINLGGQAETSNYFTLDGINNIDTAITGPAVVPSVEDIQEFKIYTGADFEAEYGHNVGGQIVVTSRSGGNAYHGDIYEFLRNQIFDAKNFFQTSGTKLSYKRNDFGGTFGGHIIPDKMFFFFSGEVLLLHNQYTALSTIPTVAEIGGNFAGQAPLTVPAGYPSDLINTANNSINFAALTTSQEMQANTVGAALLSYYPADTTPGSSNYNFNAENQEKSETYQLRLDNNINARNTTYATLNWFNNPEITPSNTTCSVSSIPGFACDTSLTDQLYGGGWTHIFTPNVINDFVAGYQRSNVPRFSEDDNNPFDETYNIPAFEGPPTPEDNGIPYTEIEGYANYGDATNLPQSRRDNSYDYLDTVLWNKGTHSFKFGAEYTRILDAVLFVSAGRGEFIFNGTYTGNPVADAVLGLPTEALRNNQANPIVHGKESYFAGFAEDSWKILPNLTLNYGLRWEATTPYTSGNDYEASFDLATGEPFIGCVNGQPCHVWHAFNGGWAPRLGLSYRPFKNDNTVWQAGFGVANDAVYSLGSLLALQDAYPIRISQTFIGTAAAPLSLPNPFSGNGTTALSPDGIAPNFRTAQSVSYTLGVQQKLASNLVATINYQGSETSHIANSYNVNQSMPQATAALGNSSRPYGQWTSISYEFARAHANYNALYTKLQQNAGHGLTFIIAYTWAKSEDNNVTPQDIYDLAANRGLSNFDVRNRFVASPVYDLPFGSGREFLNSGWVSKIVGNWEVAGEIALQNGTPVTPTDGANVSNNGETSGDRPYVTDYPNHFHHHIAEWFNVLDYNYQNVVSGTTAPCTTAPCPVPQTQANSFPGVTVVPPAPKPYGNARPGSIQSPGYENVDVNIARTFVLPRTMSLQFRGELFDAFNEPQFEQPSGTFTGFQETGGVVSAKGTFGRVTAANGARNIEFALKLFF